MPIPWQIATSSGAGALITLIGVFVGATLTGRTQRRLWNRGKQIDTCTDILAESTRIQQALVGKWKHDTAIEWVPWNQALAAIWLVGEPEVVEAALNIDRTFWKQSARVYGGEITDEASWAIVREVMDADRLNFINAVRTHVLESSKPLAAIPTGRRALLDTTGTDDATQSTESLDAHRRSRS